LEKLAFGRFSDNGFVFAGKRRGFCRLRRPDKRGQAFDACAGRIIEAWRLTPAP
jgi:hypothetical protein